MQGSRIGTWSQFFVAALCLAAAGPALGQELADATKVTGISLGPARQAVPVWETALNHPGDPKYVSLDYIVLFVSTQGFFDPSTFHPVNLGQDVFAANNPAPQGPGGGLFAVLPDGRVKKLFPLAAHENTPGLIDTPLGELEVGAVVEPNISEDGTKVYFGYFHDQTWKKNGGGWHSKELSYKGCDLYSIDLAPLLADNDFDPHSLVCRRLTFKEYAGPPKDDVKQTDASKFAYALNPTLVNSLLSDWGSVDMHMIEMRTESGLKAVWVSDRSRVGNSNDQVTTSNHNFNVFEADILPDGSLGHPHQFQYYTTTSALSPTPLRDGMAFSYQSSTEGFRRWDIQAVTSSGIWSPLIGFGHDSRLFHLGTMVTADVGNGVEDHFIGVKYYNQNDGGFGQLHRVRLADAGTNHFVSTSTWAVAPQQISVNLTPDVTSQDQPSGTTLVDNQVVYYGKLSSPRAGRLGGEYLVSYTPTSANRWILDADGLTGVFDSHIAYRPDLGPFDPTDPVEIAAGKGLRILVDDENNLYDYNLIWPTPVLSWQERYGSPTQSFSPSVIDPATTIAPGEPFAQVGTSAIWNTDLRPYDCWLGSGQLPYSPNAINSNAETYLDKNVDQLRYVQDPADLCAYLLPSTVLAIQVNMTSNRVDLDSLNSPGFETDQAGDKEATEILGVYAPGVENVSDQSFIARIPADVPFDFHLLDSKYGMKLVDVRSWHSLQPRETRTNCGGCHQHEAGFGIPFEGTEASAKAPLDMTSLTQFVAYDPDCKPTIQVSTDNTLRVPEWTQDIWPEFDQYCGTCHDSTQSSDAAALAALDYSGEAVAYSRLKSRNYASTITGALGSPAFWAAYGERTDGRDNTLPIYQPNHAAGNWGYKFSAIHATQPGLCAASNPAWADWVQRFGLWIDNHMPRSTGGSAYGYHFDRFHPTVDMAYTGVPGQIRIGYWDNRRPLTLEVAINGQTTAVYGGLINGSMTITDAGLLPTDKIEVKLTDPSGNRQIKEKTIQEMLDE